MWDKVQFQEQDDIVHKLNSTIFRLLMTYQVSIMMQTEHSTYPWQNVIRRSSTKCNRVRQFVGHRLTHSGSELCKLVQSGPATPPVRTGVSCDASAALGACLLEVFSIQVIPEAWSASVIRKFFAAECAHNYALVQASIRKYFITKRSSHQTKRCLLLLHVC